MERSNSLLAGTCLAISALAIAMFPGKSEARPNCPTCMAGYEACLSSGASDCDKRYAACLRWCPAKAGGAALKSGAEPVQPLLHSVAQDTSDARFMPVPFARSARRGG